jgi:tripartite-type tricarboxylate transporter receptor subunit TctC
MKVLGFLGALALGFSAASGMAQTYPSKTVTIVVPYTPGPGGIDAQARVFGRFLEKHWKQSVLIENRPGAGTAIGSADVARSAPDGYTMLAVGTSIAQIKYLQKLSFDPDTDLVPAANIAEFITLVLTNKQMGVKTWNEFITKVKADPSRFNYGSVGRSTTYLGLEAVLHPTGVKLTMVPYPGQAQYLPALLRNDVQLAAVSLTGAKPLMDTGDLVPLAVFGSERVPMLPDVPNTVNELKAPLARTFGWVGLFFPKGTPKAIVDKLAAASVEYAKDPDSVFVAEKSMLRLVGTTAEEFQATYREDAKAWGEMTRIVGLQPE